MSILFAFKIYQLKYKLSNTATLVWLILFKYLNFILHSYNHALLFYATTSDHSNHDMLMTSVTSGIKEAYM